MAILKCKMCGGDLNVAEGMSVCECDYCGTKQTVPTADDEKKLALFARANRLRLGCEFDKAAGVYEAIVSDFPAEAEAYWGLVLCKYGIEYVDDPKTKKKIPTCHRSSFDSVMQDGNFQMVLSYADPMAGGVYREEAAQIEELRRGIIAVSSKEEPYDIFICYKETDAKGERTIDSVVAQDVYNALTEEGYRVFFARISLEDKLGVEYEPYIFAALHSAKVMLVFGTDYEHFNAVWVKNEWSRFLQLIEKGEKKTLIPCYKGIDAYDMPGEFAKLQAQDMGKVGAMQDLLRGIEKILGVDKTVVKETVVVGGNPQVAPLLTRAFIFLEDGDWGKADGFCEQVLNLNPTCAEAYLGKVMAEAQVHKREELAGCSAPFWQSNNFQKAMRFGDDSLRTELQGYLDIIDIRNKEAAYQYAVSVVEKATTEEDYRLAAERFGRIIGYKDAEAYLLKCEQQIEEIHRQAEEKRKETLYRQCMVDMQADTPASLRKAIHYLQTIADWKDAAQQIEQCKQRVQALEEERKDSLYRHSVEDMEEGTVESLQRAVKGFQYIPGWRDADVQLEECQKRLSLALKERDEEEDRLAEERKKRRKKRRIIIISATVLVFLLLFFGYPLISYWTGNYKVFIKCFYVRNFTVPDGVTTIQAGTFEGCDNLETVTIPDSVTTIEENAFAECSALKEVDMGNGVTTIKRNAFYECNSLESVTIPDSVTKIGDYVFSECYGLADVHIGNGVQTIGYGAFSGCYNLQRVTILGSATEIGSYAFKECSALHEVTLGNGVATIGYCAFLSCESLESIAIPASVTKIGEDAFLGCSNLKEVHITDMAAWCGIEFVSGDVSGCYANPLEYTETLYLNGEAVTDAIVPYGVTKIRRYTFQNCDMTSVTIPDSVTTIGKYAFLSCDSLTDVYFAGTKSQWEALNVRFTYSVTVHCFDGNIY